jgi:hypothetical protein
MAFGADPCLHADLMDTHRDILVHEAEGRRLKRVQLQLDCGVGHFQVLLSAAVGDHARFHFQSVSEHAHLNKGLGFGIRRGQGPRSQSGLQGGRDEQVLPIGRFDVVAQYGDPIARPGGLRDERAIGDFGRCLG